MSTSATDLFNYRRRQSSVVHIGSIDMGGDNPIRIQSMTTTNTNDTASSVAQAERIIEAGGELVRLTTQGSREAENLKNINAGIRADGYKTPLVADIHFNPHVADVAALYAEKVRINPGNYVDPARKFVHQEYTDEEYAQELQKIEDRFVPFLNICREHHTVFLMQIGGNLKRSGQPHDGRAPDYDDWRLNGDILLWNPVLERSFEISSMGIRVDEAALDRQLTASGCDDRRTLPFHRMLLAGELPLTIGGGIGQSRLCMMMIGTCHIGEVQASLWDPETVQTCESAGIMLL